MKVHNVGAKFGSLCIRHGNHAFFGQIPIFAPGLVAGEFFQIFLDTRNDTDVGFFDIKEQWPRHRIFAIGNGIKCRLNAVYKGALNFIRVLIQKTETEYTNANSDWLPAFARSDYRFHRLRHKPRLHGWCGQIALYFFLFVFFSALIQANFLAPPSMASSTKASRVPEVGGGPSTSMVLAGNAGLTSFQVL